MTSANVSNEHQGIREQRGWRFWLSRLLLGSVVTVVALIVSSVLYEVVAQASDADRFLPPGQIVQVNGFNMHLHCVGEGDVTVILEAGANAWSDTWAVTQPVLGETTRTCSYDRPGFGWSEPNVSIATPEQQAQNLHDTLMAANIQPPYVLVGHSIGGKIIRLFTSLYPSEVAGLVFVDARHESMEPVGQSEEQILADREAFVSSFNLHRTLRTLGVVRLFGLPLGRALSPVLKLFPDEVVYRSVLFGVRETAIQTMITESRFSTANDDDLRAAELPNTLPIVVLTAEDSLQVDGWENAQAQLATLSDNSVWQKVPNTSHNLHAEQPQVVVDGVNRIIYAYAAGGMLAQGG